MAYLTECYTGRNYKQKNGMVGPNGLEPSTSSVSRFSYPIPPTTSIFAEKLLSPSKYAVHGPITG
jgi:hypothetical protein